MKELEKFVEIERLRVRINTIHEILGRFNFSVVSSDISKELRGLAEASQKELTKKLNLGSLENKEE